MKVEELIKEHELNLEALEALETNCEQDEIKRLEQIEAHKYLLNIWKSVS